MNLRFTKSLLKELEKAKTNADELLVRIQYILDAARIIHGIL
jgi:hypothetical protein